MVRRVATLVPHHTVFVLGGVILEAVPLSPWAYCVTRELGLELALTIYRRRTD